MRIAHASIDEHNHISGGEAGNQTGKEVCIRSWYNKPWTSVLRHPDSAVGDRIATIAETLASAPYNSLIGYDQKQRNTFLDVAKKYKYNVLDFINAHEMCETDCSAFVTCICLFAGIHKLEYSGNAPTTSTMVKVFKAAGFNEITDKSILTDPEKLRKGDILVKAGSHTAIAIDNGSGDAKRTLRTGMRGSDVAYLQRRLIAKGYDVGRTGADGDFGQNTFTALRVFQADNGLKPDGICGPKTWEKIG